MSTGIGAISQERWRQVFEEGWSHDHDDRHLNGELAVAAGCYAFTTVIPSKGLPVMWPFDAAWWKPSKDRRANLVKAGALIAAEIERLDRASMRHALANPGGANLPEGDTE
jgi:hypothetical protein